MKSTKDNSIEETIKKFVSDLHALGSYGFEITKKQTEFKNNPDLGYKNAASPAELNLGDHLYEELKRIGLTNVTKDRITVDGWTYNRGRAYFQDCDGQEVMALLGGQAVDCQEKGEVELLFVNRATESDLKNKEVEGKWLLATIDQDRDWWVNYPALEAKLKGARGLIVANTRGFGQSSPDALTTNDICGPKDAPVFSISVNNFNRIRAVMKARKTDEIKIRLDIDSRVDLKVPTYNIFGDIPGKDDQLVIIAAHYDAYFAGFEDDAAGVGLVLSIAKALKSANRPFQHTIRFVLHAAEEWGTTNSRYDWATGSYKQITEARPEWAEKTMVMLNIECPGIKPHQAIKFFTTFEYAAFTRKIIKQIDALIGSYPKGEKVITPLLTWSDDYAYQTQGVPCISCDDYRDEDYHRDLYHSPFDDEENFDSEAFDYQARAYGALAIVFATIPDMPFDFSTRINAFIRALNLRKNSDLAARLTAEEKDFLAHPHRHLNTGADNSTLRRELKQVEEQTSFLTSEDVFVFLPALCLQKAKIYRKAIADIESGNRFWRRNILKHLDNNVYRLSFSEAVVNFFTDQVLKQDPQRLNWGKGKVKWLDNLSYLDDYLDIFKDDAKKEKLLEIFRERIRFYEDEALKATRETIAVFKKLERA